MGIRSRVGRGLNGRLVLLAAAGLLALGFAMAPGSASAANPPVDTSPVLHVNPRGDGEGAIVQDYGFEHTISDIDCTYHPGLPVGVCQTEIDTSTEKPWDVELHASAFAGSEFLGWAVDHDWVLHGCGQETVCHLDLQDAGPGEHVDVFAYFAESPDTYPLAVLKQGSGSGVVTSEPPGISCGADCLDSYEEDAVVVLRATPDAASAFDGWGGGCAAYGASPVCTLTMRKAETVIARFRTQTFPLTVSLTGGGSGGVTSNLAPLISCPPNCAANIGLGTAVTLYADAAAGSEFAGWSGVCAPAGTSRICTFVMGSGPTAAVASFKRTPIQAVLITVKTAKFGAAGRATRITLTSGESVRVIVTIVRDGRVLASQEWGFAPSGARSLQLSIPTRVGSGSARLKVTFVNAYGTEKQVSSPITIPRR